MQYASKCNDRKWIIIITYFTFSKKLLFLLIAFLISFSLPLYAQASSELLLEKGEEYIAKGNQENIDLGVGLILESIKRNPKFAKAYMRLGIIYSDGKYIPSDYDIAYTFLKESADKLNYTPAKIEFSKMLIKLQKFEEAAKELLSLEKLNDPEVNYYLGILYMDGLGIDKNINKAKKLFVESKERGFSKSNDALNSLNSMIEEKERIKQQEEQRMKQERINNKKILIKNLTAKCAVLSENTTAWMACMKKENAIFGINLNAYYAMRNECDLLAGNDDTGLSYLCSNPSSNGCIGLKASQDTINACYQCKGSNLWLRVYATGTILKCY